MNLPNHSNAVGFVAAACLAYLVAALGVLGLGPSIVASAHAESANSQMRHATDETTRAAMVAIRDLVANNHSLVTHRRMPKAASQRMAKNVAGHLEKIRTTSQLEGDARMEMAGILEQLERGVEAVAGRSKDITAIDGIVLMDEALAQYANQFDHPEWKAPRDL